MWFLPHRRQDFFPGIRVCCGARSTYSQAKRALFDDWRGRRRGHQNVVSLALLRTHIDPWQRTRIPLPIALTDAALAAAHIELRATHATIAAAGMRWGEVWQTDNQPGDRARRQPRPIPPRRAGRPLSCRWTSCVRAPARGRPCADTDRIGPCDMHPV